MIRTSVSRAASLVSARRLPLLLIAAALFPLSVAQNGKRPLTLKDYDGWRSISNQRLSPDGKFLAYAVFPQEGDGEVVLLNLSTGKETRENAGERPQAPPPDPAAGPEEGPPQQRGVTMIFSADSRTLVCSTFPTRAEIDKAKKDKKDEPKSGLVVLDVSGEKPVVRITRVKSFQMPARASGWLAWLRESPEPASRKEEAAEKKEGDSDQQRRGTGAAPGRASSRRPEFGSELVLRSLADGAERTFADVVEFSLSEDAKDLVYSVSGKEAERNGVYDARVGAIDGPVALLAGKGKYARLTWDEKQLQLAFLSDRDGAAAKPPLWKVYRWERQATSAVEVVSAAIPGFRKEFAISDKGALTFSKDGTRLFFGCALAAPESKEETQAASDMHPVVDLWHWKDDYIQPMQKVRAERDRSRTFTAAYLIPEKKMVQLGDATLPEIYIGESSGWVLGGDDRAYRRMAEYDERYSDTWIVDLATGERKKAVSRQRGSITLSPGGRYALLFDGNNWITISLPDGTRTNLTGKLGANFFNEEHDSPGTPQAYGNGGWSKDGASLLLYDRFDVWQVAPDGSKARNLTAGAGRRGNLQFRVVRLANEDDPRDRWIDPSKPLLLRVENLETRDTGFYRTRFDAAAPPEKLVMAARNFAPPVKAKHADVYVMNAQTYRDSPDLLITDAGFRDPRPVTRINPQQEQFLWGSAEMVRFHNLDGVPLRAVLYKPENFDPKRKYPLLVYIYERLSQNVHRYVEPKPGTSINITSFVSNGYLVLTPDIAYTVGYPGQSALKAVLPAVQAVVDRGIVDEKAIGIQGHSWGGYQIAYMITQTNRFRAVAAGAPVADMISAYDGIRWGTGLPRQFQYERTQSRIGGSIWQYPTRFIENSPIFWADRVQTPLMMLHNDGDDAVPWYQGVEYYLALRRLGKEVYLFNYNGEPHGLRKRINQKDYTVRLHQYFDHFLKGAPAPAWMEKGVPYLERDRRSGVTDGKP